MTKYLKERYEEYRSHVWDHTQDPFQLTFDFRRPLVEHELRVLVELTRALNYGEDDAALATTLRGLLAQEQEAVFVVLQLIGLTRNKILTDLRAATAGSGATLPSKVTQLARSAAAWDYAGPYLAAKIRRVLAPVSDLGE